MSCPVFEEALAFAERSLPAGDREEQVISHLVDCTDCRESFVAIRRAQAALAEPVSGVDETELALSLIRRMTGRTSRRNGRLSLRRATSAQARPIWIGALAGAAAAVVVFMILAALFSARTVPSGPRTPGGDMATPPRPDSEKGVTPIGPSRSKDEPDFEPRKPELPETPVERIPDVQPPQPIPNPPEESPTPDVKPGEEPPATPQPVPPTRVAPLRREFVGRVCQVDGKVVTDRLSKGLKLGDMIPWGEEIAIPAKGRLGLRLPDGGWVYLQEGAKVRFDTLDDGGTQTDILAGDAFFDLPKQEVPFRGLAGAERVHVVGKSFMISRGEKETKLVVEGGKVVFSNALGQVVVTGGHSSVARENSWPTRPERTDVGEELGWVRSLGDAIIHEKFEGRVKLGDVWREVQEAKFTTGQRLNGLAMKVTNADDKVRAAGLISKQSFTLDSPIRIRAKFKLDSFADNMSFNVGFARRSDEGLSGDLWRWSILNNKEVLRVRKSGQDLEWIHWETSPPGFKSDAWHTVEVTLDSRWIGLSIDGQRIGRTFLSRPIREEVQAGVWVYLGGAQTVEALIDEIVVERLR